MPILWLRSKSFGSALFLAVSLVGLFGLVACGGDDAPGEKVAQAPAGAGETGSAVESPAPPPPAPALNQYADQCLGGELPAEEPELRRLTTGCMEHLLETLRAVIGAVEAPQAEVGPRLDEAEVAVHRLALEVSRDDFPARVQQAAISLVELAASVSEVLAAGDAEGHVNEAVETEARAAAEGLDGETELVEQATALSRFLRTIDGLVRPQVRQLSQAPPTGV